jgi:predicted nucleic acid-binding protein
MQGLALVDSNVILDVLTEDEKWFSWSSQSLSFHADRGLLAINPIIYAEISVGFKKIEDLEATLLPGYFTKLDLPWEAAFLAGKCFLKYRKREGSRRSPLPDFYIGAHAAVLGIPLITRDHERYKTYFPSLEIISP